LGNETDKGLHFELSGEQQNPTLFAVLVNASYNNPEFEATFKHHPEFEAYIVSMGGLYENANKSLFWMVYEIIDNEEKQLDKGM